MTDELEPIVIWTDGACSGNPGPGGWAFVKTFDGKAAGSHGGEPHTTNNRMEIAALLRALKSIPEKREAHPVLIHSDSAYVVNGVNDYLAAWIANGWRTSGKAPVANQDLWEQVAGQIAKRSGPVRLARVKSHTGMKDQNAFVDALAVRARDHAKTADKPFFRKVSEEALATFPMPSPNRA
jgi:ribonuclease HI